MPQLCENGQRIVETALQRARDRACTFATEAGEEENTAKIRRLKDLMRDSWEARVEALDRFAATFVD